MFVVAQSGLEAVVELAKELVEQVPLGLTVPVSGCAAGVEVSAGAGRGLQRRQRPDRDDDVQAFVLDVAGEPDDLAAAGAGDGRGTGVGS